MDIVNLTIFSTIMAILGSFQSISFTAIQPRYDFPERLQGAFRISYVMGQVGEALTWVFPPRYFNGSLMEPGEFVMTLPSRSPNDLKTASMPASSGDLYSEIDNQSSALPQSVTVLSDTMDDNRAFDFGSGWLDFGILSRFLHRFGPSSHPDTGDLPRQHPLVWCLTNPFWVIGLFMPVVAMKVVILSLGSVFRRKEYMRVAQMADLEILTFVKEIRAKKVAHLMKLDEELSVADREVNEISTRIKSERERICIELASLRINAVIQGEVKEVRKSIELRFQNEFERLTELEWYRPNMVSPNGHHGFATQTAIEVQEDVPDPKKSSKPVNESLVEEEQSQPQQQHLEQTEERKENDPKEDGQPNDEPKGSLEEQTENADTNNGSSSGSSRGSPAASEHTSSTSTKKRSRPSKARRQKTAKRTSAQFESPSLVPHPLKVS